MTTRPVIMHQVLTKEEYALFLFSLMPDEIEQNHFISKTGCEGDVKCQQGIRIGIANVDLDVVTLALSKVHY